jgi:hypothetical protein
MREQFHTSGHRLIRADRGKIRTSAFEADGMNWATSKFPLSELPRSHSRLVGQIGVRTRGQQRLDGVAATS